MRTTVNLAEALVRCRRIAKDKGVDDGFAWAIWRDGYAHGMSANLCDDPDISNALRKIDNEEGTQKEAYAIRKYIAALHVRCYAAEKAMDALYREIDRLRKIQEADSKLDGRDELGG